MATITKSFQGDFGAFCDGTTNDTFAYVDFGNWAMANQGNDDIVLTFPSNLTSLFNPNSVQANWLVGPQTNVTNVTSNGGKVRLTVADSTGFIDTEVANVWGLTGTPLGNGLQTLDVINGTTIDLPAISFVGNGRGSICRVVSQKGVKNLTLEGNGSTILYTGAGGASNPNFGMRGIYQDAYHSARTATVAAGATAITLNDPLLSVLFTANTYACMCGYDIQGVYKNAYGFPNNAHFFEYVFITNVDAPTGVITIQSPLRNTYKSTWPNWNSGDYFEVDAGGPATLYSLPASWNTSLIYHNLTFDNQTQQVTARVRDVTFDTVTAIGSHGVIPSMNRNWTAINCVFTDANIEMDKLIETVTFNGSVARFLKFQSSSTETLLMDNSSVVVAVNGTPKTAVITNSTLPTLQPGCYAYGKSTRVSCTNCAITNLTEGGIIEDAVNTKGVNQSWDMVNGVIIIPNGALISNVTDNGSNLVRLTVDNALPFINSTNKWIGISNVAGAVQLNTDWKITYINSTTIDLQSSNFSTTSPYTASGYVMPVSQGEDNPTRALIPGTWCTWGGTLATEAFPFKIIDVTQDVNSTYVQTSLSGGFPNVPLAGGTRLVIHQMPVQATFVNCTVDPDVVGYSQFSGERPLFSYAKKTYTETELVNTMPIMYLYGYIKRINITVNTPYAGAGTLNLKPFGQFQPKAVIPPDYSAVSTTQFCQVDLKTAGTRSYVAGTGWTGSVGADVLSDPGVIWFGGDQLPFISTTFSGACSVTVEVFTDEGFDLVSLARGHNRWLNR